MAPYIGTGVSIGSGVLLGQQVTPPWYGDLAPDLAFVLNANEYNAANGISQIGDDTGNGLLFTATDSGAQPAFNATGVGSAGAVEFTSGDNLQLASAAALNGLKDEYGIALYIRGVNTAATQTVLSTYLQTGGSQNGLRLIFQGTSRTFWILEQKAGAIIMNAQSATYSIAAPPADYRVFIRVSRSGGSPHLKMYVNGTSVKTADYSATTFSGNPDQALKLAYAPGTGNNFLGGMFRAGMLWGSNPVTGSGLSDDEFALAVDAALVAAVSQRETRVIVPFGDSITASAAGYRRQLMTAVRTGADYHIVYNGTQTAAGNFPLADKRHEGVAGETVAQIETRVAAYTPSGSETDIVLLAGTNSVVSRGASGALSDLASLIATTKSKFPGRRVWVFEIPYGQTDIATNFSAAGVAGTFNAGLDAVIAAAGSGVTKIPIHAAGGATTYIWVPGTSGAPGHATDDVGHPTVTGGELQGNAAAQAMGFIA